MKLKLEGFGRKLDRLIHVPVMAFLMIAISTQGAGCNLKEKISSSLADEIVEEDTETEYEWPEGKAARYLPVLEAGEITYVLNETRNCKIELKQITQEDYDNYLVKLVEEGYSEDESITASKEQRSFTGSNRENAIIELYFNNTENSLEITATVEVSKDSR